MGKSTLKRKPLGHIALWIFRAYCLFFLLEIFRFYQGMKNFPVVEGNEMATNIGIAAGGVIVFVPLLALGLFLFLFSWMTRGKPESKAIEKKDELH